MLYFQRRNYVYNSGQQLARRISQLEIYSLMLDNCTTKKGFSKTVPCRSQEVGDRLIKTLRPEKMVEVGQKLHCIVLPLHRYCIQEGQQLHRLYITNANKRSKRSEFTIPNDTQGVFYYHRDPGLPEIAGQIRYRLCNDVSRFFEGRDLECRSFVPWSLPIPHVLQADPLREGFGALVLKDGLINEDMIETLQDLPVDNIIERCLFRFDQPFIFDLSQQIINCIFVAKNFRQLFRLPGLRDFRVGPHYSKTPYKGLVRARFELSNLSEHEKQGPTILLRILEILTPVQSKWPDYDQYLELPRENALISRDLRGRGYKPWSYRLNTRADGKSLEEFIRLTSPEVKI